MTIQVGLGWHANQIASASAREAARVARVGGGTVGLRDGEVSLTNADGGCRFTVRLPAAAAAALMPSSE
jgi:hypothetical protein